MLSRSAQGLYWMGRYLERASHMCRLLRSQMAALVDRPAHEIQFGWTRIYRNIGRTPPYGGIPLGSANDAALGDFGDSFALADSYTLADDLTFERSNPDSVWSCFAMGRENARQMRHCISAEMWLRLNMAYLRIQGMDIRDIWQVSPETFYAETTAELDTFAGVAESTMYRDAGWGFMRLGRFLERTQMTAGLILAQVETAKSSGDPDAGWSALLRISDAFEAYNRRYSVEARPHQVMDLLVTDPLLPASLSRSLDMLEAEIEAIGAGPDADSSAAARRLAGRMGALVRYEWPDREDREDALKLVERLSRELHFLVSQTYFEYGA